MNHLSILFADDELHNIEALIETARAEGYDVLTCRNASEAIRIVLEEGVDCLVLDIMMDPGPDLPSVDPQSAGLVAVDRILSERPRQSIVCLSVIGDQTIINGLKRRGVLYLRKAETPLRKAWQVIEGKTTGVYRDA